MVVGPSAQGDKSMVWVVSASECTSVSIGTGGGQSGRDVTRQSLAPQALPCLASAPAGTPLLCTVGHTGTVQ